MVRIHAQKTSVRQWDSSKAVAWYFENVLIEDSRNHETARGQGSKKHHLAAGAAKTFQANKRRLPIEK